MEIGSICTCWSLKLVTIGILGSPPRTRAVDQSVVTMTERYAILTRVITTTKITSKQASNLFFFDWIIIHEIQDTVLSENSQQFLSKLFTTLRCYFETNKLKRSVFHPPTYGRVEGCNKMLASRFSLYIGDNQKNYDIFV